MSRNSSGTYTLPSGNPVVSGTLIEATWANTTLDDLASAMTDSLSRSGQGGMTAALRLYDGTSSVPGLAWGSETTTGWYRAGAGDMRLVMTGTEVMKYLTTGVSITGTLSASGNFAINTDKFTVAASTGNTAVAGTLAVTGASTFSGLTNTFENSTAYYPQLINRNKTADANGSYISLQKIRNASIVQNGDVLGNVIFAGYDGAAYLQGAFINAVISATPGLNDMPTDLVFGTTSDGGAGPTERLRISNTGAGTASADWTFYGVRVGRGAGAVSSNTAVGASALAANTSGSRSVAVGDFALAANTTGYRNVALGSEALTSNTTGYYNTGLGWRALNVTTTGNENTASGYYALLSNTTGSFNTAHGGGALQSNTTANGNTAVGYQAAYANTTGANNVSIGNLSMADSTTGASCVAVGDASLRLNTTGNYNTAIGQAALRNNTTASYNTAIGYQAGYTNSTGQYNTFIGRSAGYNVTGGWNVLVGEYAGYNVTGNNNTFVGQGSGYLITSGAKNTILGTYSGNQGGLNITTSSNYIVLSDGDGNPRLYMVSDGQPNIIGLYNNTTASGANVFIASTGFMYRSTSALKYKQDVRDLEELDINLLRPVRYKSKCEGDDQTKDYLGLIADEAAEAGFEELVSRGADGEVEGFQYERLTVVLLKELQTLKAKVAALENK